MCLNIIKKVEEIKLPDSYKKLLEERYEAIGKFLDEKLGVHVNVYAQGSAQQGTLIKHSQNNTFDVDIVVEVPWNILQSSQKELKEAIGKYIKEYAKENNMLNEVIENKRAWQLTYQHENFDFHIDITPIASYNGKYYLTNASSDYYTEISYNWESTNPKGFDKWFKLSMDKVHQDRFLPLQQYEKLSILQESIMLIKYMRDVNCASEKFKSIAITTICTHVFSKSNSIEEVVNNFQMEMSNIISRGYLEILNPTTLDTVIPENFIEKWNELDEDELQLLKDFIDNIMDYFALIQSGFENGLSIILEENEYDHQEPITVGDRSCKIKLKGTNDGRTKSYSTGAPIKIGTKLEFSLVGNKINSKTEEVMWQVTNQKSKALKRGPLQLRGELYTPNRKNNKMYEQAEFAGFHTVRMVTRDKRTKKHVRSSDVFVVNIVEQVC